VEEYFTVENLLLAAVGMLVYIAMLLGNIIGKLDDIKKITEK
jgi:hypothetical protein